MVPFVVAGVGAAAAYFLLKKKQSAAAAPQPSAQTATIDTQAGSGSTPISAYQPGGFLSTTAPQTAVGLAGVTSGYLGGNANLLESNALYGSATPSAQVTQAPGGSPVIPAANPAAPQ
jgi:hypothetical protein